MADASNYPPPFWHRSRFRWVNGLGFAMTLALALWLLLAAVGQLVPEKNAGPFPYPMIYMVVGGLALVATVALFAILLFRFLWQGVDFSHYKPRVYLFLWSLAGLLFFAVQGLLLLMFEVRPMPNVAAWAQDFIWFMCPFGVITFAILAYVNSELPHDEDDELYDDEHDEWDEHDEAYAE